MRSHSILPVSDVGMRSKMVYVTKSSISSTVWLERNRPSIFSAHISASHIQSNQRKNEEEQHFMEIDKTFDIFHNRISISVAMKFVFKLLGAVELVISNETHRVLCPFVAFVKTKKFQFSHHIHAESSERTSRTAIRY